MNICRRNHPASSGFTIIEIIVAIAIIVILLTIILASISQARASTRDKKRISDVANIEFALTLYKEQNREYPDVPTGVEIGVDDPTFPIDETIRQYNGNEYSDPLSDGTLIGEYGYWYYSDFECNGQLQDVIIVKKMESSKNGNFEEVCGSGAQLPFNILKQITPVAQASGGGSPSRSDCRKELRRYEAGRSRYTLEEIYANCPSLYRQSAYYTQSTYAPAYSQSTYYAQSTYYTQAQYYPWDDGEESGVYIIILKQ